MRTTLTIDDDVAAALERLRRADDKSLKEVVDQTLRQGLKQRDAPKNAQAQLHAPGSPRPLAHRKP